MLIRFSLQDDGTVNVYGSDEPSLMVDALNDCVSSLPPRGEECIGPSTYWIDHALQSLQRAIDTQYSTPFTSGNHTELSWTNDEIRAHYDWDTNRNLYESISIDEFKSLLKEWRLQVLASAENCTTSLPESYRRNPA